MNRVINVQNAREKRSIAGPQDSFFKLIKEQRGVSIYSRGKKVHVIGPDPAGQEIYDALNRVVRLIRKEGILDNRRIERLIMRSCIQGINMKKLAKTDGQRLYLNAIDHNDMVFCVGPAGTGKTLLAVAQAINHLERGKVERIVLVRPAVEAGEKLGFLPGSLDEKIDPYVRPMLDSLHKFTDPAILDKYFHKGIIEVMPLAYMRGCTFEKAFVILDEAQNVTAAQMLMFLTRFGYGSKCVIIGDDTQVDLPRGSGLNDALDALAGIDEIALVELGEEDIVRHPLVTKIVNAYQNQNRFYAA